jgi:hypothetical protein
MAKMDWIGPERGVFVRPSFPQIAYNYCHINTLSGKNFFQLFKQNRLTDSKSYGMMS